MNWIRKPVLVLGVFGLCSGCTTPFDAVSSSGIRTIALSGFDEPTYAAQNRFVLNTSSVKPQRLSSFATLMDEQNLHLGFELKAKVVQALQGDGYQIAEGDSAADAVLNIKIAGAPPNGVPLYESTGEIYEPEFSAAVTLKNSKTKHTLFFELYVYRDNSFEPLDGSILIRPDSKFAFRTSEELFNNPKLAAEGFRAAVPIIAQSIASALKKP